MRKQWKRTMRRIIACVLIVALVLPNTVVAAPKPEINKKSIILCKKEKYQLKISHQRKKPKWKTTNKKVVSVSKNGFIKGKKSGTATITGYAGGKKYKCKVTVADTKKSVYAGKTISLKSKSLKKYKKWNSSSTKIATVNKSGKVKAKKAGTVVITAKYKKKTYRFKLTVKKPEPATIYVDKYSNEAITTDKSDYVLSGTIKSKGKIKKVSASYNSDSNTKTKSLTINGRKKWKTKKIPLNIGYNYVTIAVSLTSGKSVKKKIQVNRTNTKIDFKKNVKVFNPESEEDFSVIKKIKSEILDTIIDNKGTDDVTDDELLLVVENDNPLLEKIKNNEIKKNDIVYISPNKYFVDGLTQKYMYCDDNYTGDLNYNPDQCEVIHLKSADFSDLFSGDVYISSEGLNEKSELAFVYTAAQNANEISQYSMTEEKNQQKMSKQTKFKADDQTPKVNDPDSIIEYDSKAKTLKFKVDDFNPFQNDMIKLSGELALSEVNPVFKLNKKYKKKDITFLESYIEYKQVNQVKVKAAKDINLKKMVKECNKEMLGEFTESSNILSGVDMENSIILAVAGIKAGNQIKIGNMNSMVGEPGSFNPTVFIALILDLDGSINVELSVEYKKISYHKTGAIIKDCNFNKSDMKRKDLQHAAKEGKLFSNSIGSFAIIDMCSTSKDFNSGIEQEEKVGVNTEGKANFSFGIGVGAGVGVAGIVPLLIKVRLQNKTICSGKIELTIANYKLQNALPKYPNIIFNGRAMATDSLAFNICITARIKVKIGDVIFADYIHDKNQKGKNVITLLDMGLWAVTDRGIVIDKANNKLSDVKVSFIEIKDNTPVVLGESTRTYNGEYTIGGFYQSKDTSSFSKKKFALMYEKEGYKNVIRELDDNYWLKDDKQYITEMSRETERDKEINDLHKPSDSSYDCISFGKYWQNNNADKTSIKWRVLDIGLKYKEAVLISENILEVKPYNVNKKVTWNTSMIRSYLNGYSANKNSDAIDFSAPGDSFLYKAFDENDRESMRKKFYNKEGKEVDDLVVLPGRNVIKNGVNGFDGDNSRIAKTTKYAREMADSRYVDDSYILSSSNESPWSAVSHHYVSPKGEIIESGIEDPNTIKYGGIRPMIIIDLKTADWEKVGTYKYK